MGYDRTPRDRTPGSARRAQATHGDLGGERRAGSPAARQASGSISALPVVLCAARRCHSWSLPLVQMARTMRYGSFRAISFILAALCSKKSRDRVKRG
jgi:hypothetical protein